MTALPILTAESILTTAIRDALAPYVNAQTPQYNGKPKVYYRKAQQGASLPYVIFQFQSDINPLKWIGENDATALLTLKAMVAGDNNYQAALSLLAAVAPGMDAITADDYTINAVYDRTPILPEETGSTQAGHIYRINIARE